MKIWIDGSGYNGYESKHCIVIEGRKPIITLLKEKKTNNEMEYSALYSALEEYSHNRDVIYTDSQLLVGHLTRGWKQNYAHLRLIADKCKKLLDEKKVKLIWIPREENKAGRVLEDKNEF